MTLERLQVLQDTVRRMGLDAAVLFHSRDVLYYTGTAQPSYLVVRPQEYCLFVHHGMEFARRESFLPEGSLEKQKDLRAILRRMLPRAQAPCRVGTELDLLPVAQARQWQGQGGLSLSDISPEVLEQRMIKSSEEVELISQACAAAQAGVEAARARPARGLSELELSAAMEHAQRLAGHEGVTFLRRPGVIMGRGTFASGTNLLRNSGVLFTITGTGLSPAVPVGASRRRLQDGDLVLADLSPCLKGYHADQSRMFCLGQPPDQARRTYQSLRRVADHVLEKVRPGHSAGQVFEMASATAAALGIGEGFMAFPSGTKAPFVGHGLGLELNEPPLLARGSSQVLAADMVLALEMHFSTPDMVLKLEDTLLLGEDGGRLLSISPREIMPLG